MLPRSVRYCPGSKRGLFSIVIFDLLQRSALVGFHLLRAIYYYNRNDMVCYAYTFYNPYSYGELSTFVLSILSRDKPADVYLLILYFDLQGIHHFFFCNHHKTLLISRIWNQFLL